LKISPVVHQTLSDVVAGRIAMLILDGTLSPGEQLPAERELTKQLGVSRPTFREALKFLEDNHLAGSAAGSLTYQLVFRLVPSRPQTSRPTYDSN
jgi:DNA-binding FadR family transcriptional regulator